MDKISCFESGSGTYSKDCISHCWNLHDRLLIAGTRSLSIGRTLTTLDVGFLLDTPSSGILPLLLKQEVSRLNVVLATRKPLSEGFPETREDQGVEWDSNWIAELTKRLFFDSSFLLSDADHTRLSGMKLETSHQRLQLENILAFSACQLHRLVLMRTMCAHVGFAGSDNPPRFLAKDALAFTE